MTSSCYFCLLFLVSFFHFCLSTQNFNHVLCKDVERQALLQFKHGLIDGADNLAPWVDEERECCNWAGIVCANYTGHVQQIHLRGLDYTCHAKIFAHTNKRKLGRDLSPSILQLKQLRHLDLSCNDFEGIQIPSFLGSLRNLRYLNLSNAGFAGIIPPQLGNLSELQVLGLKSFHDDGQLSMLNMQWLSSLRLLRHLDMSGVDLSKAIDWFQVMNTLPSLAELCLSDCQLSHVHPHVPSLNITSLTLLDLSRNYLVNISMPRWIFSTTSLVSLDLSWCSFQGPTHNSIDGFHNLTSLKFLQLSRNNLMNSSLVLGSNLLSLDISYCDVSSSDLAGVHNLTSLLSLDLSNNQLTKPIPISFGNLCKLKEIDLSFNHFDNMSLTYLLESFLECKSPCLESLALRATGLSGHLPDQLRQLIHLVNLNLRSNSFVGVILNSIGGLASLEMLDLSDNQLNGSFPDSLGQLSKLNYLDLSSNLLTGVVTEAHFAKLTGLKLLNGRGNNIILRPQLANWIPPFQLQHLDLNSWGLGPQFPSWLLSQRDLSDLDISNTNISAPMPPSFWISFPNLTYLDMSQNHFQGTLPSFPATPDVYDILDLSSNEFTGKLPHLSDGFSAYLLDLSNNSFTGSLHHFLCPYDEIRVDALNLGNNHLSGVIPECWVKWQRLLFLNLENNNLSGGVPKTLGFSYNLGRIPEKIGDLKSLESFDLSLNKLSGELPASLSSLSFLSNFNVSYNSFTGRIPSSTQLQSLNEFSFIGNNLCGDPLTKQCAVEVGAINQVEEEDDEDGADMGLIISIVLGLVTVTAFSVPSFTVLSL
ncbi:Leucine-rich repeat-containing protein [Cynara cardunculus var. scolymus]|uniref:Leucine-rich repeat-containing protein n=1 Tax=Cynara cardunculus var. scolymus TaxID=59895 RepID=A0A103YJ48_CYNCS|nr:Leucine-rich repeat-containing protein [Cynara cardunculus var. scolymus]